MHDRLCASHIGDLSAPDCLRRFLEFHIRPTSWDRTQPKPTLFATVKSLRGGQFAKSVDLPHKDALGWIGKRVQVVGANDADVGYLYVTTKLSPTDAYRLAVGVEDLSDFSDSAGMTFFGRPLRTPRL